MAQKGLIFTQKQIFGKKKEFLIFFNQKPHNCAKFGDDWFSREQMFRFFSIWPSVHSKWEPTNNIFERKFDKDGPRTDLGLDFEGVLGDIWKIS